MKLKAKDTLFISAVSSENILPGATFEVSDQQGRSLIKRGLAVKVSPPKKKAAEPPANKKAAEPQNKAASEPKDN